jgi:MYXO-CTERM domain-containing protein
VGAPEDVEDGCSCATRGSLESARFAGLTALALALGAMRRRRSSREGRKTRRVENEQ